MGAMMKTVAMLTILAVAGLVSQASAGDKRRTKDRDSKASEVRIIAVGGYRTENLYAESEAWHRDKQRKAKDDKARRDSNADARLAREETRRQSRKEKAERDHGQGREKSADAHAKKARGKHTSK